jgi:prophage antirepressor-like protein
MKILPSEFDGQSIRRVFDKDLDIWWFSVIDVVQVLTESKSAKRYWSDLKRKLAKEAGSDQPYEEIVRLKLTTTDGKQRETDCAKAATLLRIVQSIPSPKAEPIKLWLAKVGYERMQEMADPALSLNRARQTWQQHGRSDKWIAQRMTGQETRNKLTDYWADHDIKAGQEFAILTNIIHTEWSGVSVKDHKAFKGLSSHNLPCVLNFSHDRGRTHIYRTGRAVYPPDC